ncbi:NUDIX domain-containing protein [Candidatus Pacearchaeota archaeon]|nr:NUDIX domain-containing protein [Candidatus Pacearchaeota archaeon]
MKPKIYLVNNIVIPPTPDNPKILLANLDGTPNGRYALKRDVHSHNYHPLHMAISAIPMRLMDRHVLITQRSGEKDTFKYKMGDTATHYHESEVNNGGPDTPQEAIARALLDEIGIRQSLVFLMDNFLYKEFDFGVIETTNPDDLNNPEKVAAENESCFSAVALCNGEYRPNPKHVGEKHYWAPIEKVLDAIDKDEKDNPFYKADREYVPWLKPSLNKIIQHEDQLNCFIDKYGTLLPAIEKSTKVPRGVISFSGLEDTLRQYRKSK